MPGTYTGDHDWYPFRRSRLVPIQAIMPGTHSGGYAWYTSTINDTMSSAVNWWLNGLSSVVESITFSSGRYNDPTILCLDEAKEAVPPFGTASAIWNILLLI